VFIDGNSELKVFGEVGFFFFWDDYFFLFFVFSFFGFLVFWFFSVIFQTPLYLQTYRVLPYHESVIHIFFSLTRSSSEKPSLFMFIWRCKIL